MVSAGFHRQRQDCTSARWWHQGGRMRCSRLLRHLRRLVQLRQAVRPALPRQAARQETATGSAPDTSWFQYQRHEVISGVAMTAFRALVRQ